MVNFLFDSLYPTLIFLVSTLVLFHSLSRGWRLYGVAAKRNTAPMAPGRWPVIGHIHLLEKLQLSHFTLGAMADKCGPIFTIRLGLRSAVVVSNWETAKQCFYMNDAAVSSRVKLSGREHLTYNFGMFPFALETNAHWREMRKIATSELLSNRRVDELKHVVFSEVETSLRELYQTWEKNKDSSGQVLVDLKSWFEDLTFNMILRVLIGKRYFGAVASGVEEEGKQFKKAIKSFMRLINQDLLGDYLPCLAWLDVGGYVKAMKRTTRELDKLLAGWLEEHKRNRASSMTAETKQVCLNTMLLLFDGKEILGYDSDTSIKATILSLILGGSETSNVTLTWAVCFLLNSPHVLKMAQKELDNHIGRDRLLDESDIINLTYLQAIVKETLRLYPAGPVLSSRKFNEDCVIAGFHVPKGTQLIANIWKIQTDPSIWPDPLEFKPERFRTTHKDVDVRGNHFELLPFGSGRRGCPGISFGLQTLHLALCGLLQAFNIRNPSMEAVEMSGSTGLTNEKATPLNVAISPRLPFNLYN